MPPPPTPHVQRVTKLSARSPRMSRSSGVPNGSVARHWPHQPGESAGMLCQRQSSSPDSASKAARNPRMPYRCPDTPTKTRPSAARGAMVAL